MPPRIGSAGRLFPSVWGVLLRSCEQKEPPLAERPFHYERIILHYSRALFQSMRRLTHMTRARVMKMPMLPKSRA